jgi:hypothetical protein
VTWTQSTHRLNTDANNTLNFASSGTGCPPSPATFQETLTLPNLLVS